MKKSLGAGEWVRRALGVAVLLGVVAIAFGLDTGILTRLSLANTASLEQRLIDKVRPTKQIATTRVTGSDLPVEGTMPELAGATGWINSAPLTRASLKGKVVLVDFWTYSCINCLRALPYVRAWAEKYKDHGLVVIGVHAPEFAFERDPGNVQRAVKDLNVTYPVALDSNLAIWQAFNNEYWPAHYFIDGDGRIRAHHFGEGEYDKSEEIIQKLLKEAGNTNVPGGIVDPNAGGTLAAADIDDRQSPETYVGYGRGQNFAGDHVADDKPSDYTTPGDAQSQSVGPDRQLDHRPADDGAEQGARQGDLPLPRARSPFRARTGEWKKHPCDSASRSTARRRATRTAWTRTTPVKAR